MTAVEEVLSGRAQYGVARSELLLHRLQGKPVVALATIFQHSAIILLAKEDSGISTPRDMIGRRVMLLEGDNAAEYLATFIRAGVNLDQINVVPASFNIQDLIDGKTDVFNGYITNEPYLLERSKIPYTIIKPMDYGIDFYGDTLFTSESELASHPEQVKAFRAASIRGWEYAMSHREEIITLLIQKYKADKSPSHLRYEANAMDSLILPDLVPMGQMLDKHWEKMAETYMQLGLVKPGYTLNNFLYTPPVAPDYVQMRYQAIVMAIGFVMAFIVMLLFLNRKLKGRVAERMQELAMSEKLFRSIYDNMASGVAIYEARDNGNDFVIKDLNPAGCQHSKVIREKILNKSVKEVFPGVEELGLFAVLQRVWQTGKTESLSASLYHDDRVTQYMDNFVAKLPSGQIVSIFSDLTEEVEAGKKQDFYRKRLEALWNLSSMESADLKGIGEAILQEVVAITGSEYGFYGLLDDKEQILNVYAWSQQAIEQCAVDNVSLQFSIADSGVWGNAVRERKPFILKDYALDAPHKNGIPAGHVSLSRVLSVPILMGGRIVAVAAVANKRTDYLEEDVEQITAFLKSAQVVIERKQHEMALVEAKEEWQKSFDAIPDLVTIRDKNMRLVRANKATEQFFNVQSGGLQGRYCYEVFSCTDQLCPGCPKLDTTKDHKIGHETITYEMKGKIFLKSFASIEDESGQPKYFITIAKDITAQKRLEEELFQAQKMEAIGTLAGGIAHDFNNLLAAILGYAELIKQGLQAGTATVDDIQQIIAAGRRAGALVQQILDFSHKTTQQLQPVQPALIVREVLQLLRASLPASIEIQENIDPDCGVILADPTKFYQVIMNLCTNAFQSMKEEKGILRVTLERRERTGAETRKGSFAAVPCVVLSISDTGCGMSPETMAHIFDPFFSTKEKGKGTGLGLSVVHGIVGGYKGSIDVQSSPGKGSIFRVQIPVMAQPLMPVELPKKKEEKEATKLFGTERILVIDDEFLLVKVSQRMLEDFGYTVTGTMDSKQALAMVQADPQQFDLIITDQTMPGMTGSELARAVLALVPTMPIILCTGHSAVTSKEEALAMGIRRYLYKPLQVDELVRTVREVLNEQGEERRLNNED
ncbi:MAG: ABC transporter substrate-binding protein [Desulfobulbaceae bacterium]|nr:ABC transporter substrate-binding protein [Desulfobulbaceae bacterium]